MKRLIALFGLAVATSCGQLELIDPANVSAMDRQLAGNSQEPALVRHVLFFDVNGDRLISFTECKQRLMDLGLGRVSSGAIALVFNGFFGPRTNEKFAFVIRADEIAKGMHRSDTGIFDKTGRMIPARFDAVFETSDANRDNTLDEREIDEMIARHREEATGSRISKAEFAFLMMVASDRTVSINGKSVKGLSRERLQSFYDGTLFYQIAADRHSVGEAGKGYAY